MGAGSVTSGARPKKKEILERKKKQVSSGLKFRRCDQDRTLQYDVEVVSYDGMPRSTISDPCWPFRNSSREV